MRPGLTLLCVTRDQGPKLMRLLQSVQGVVEDILVVDTGSKDLTKGIAQHHGARVVDFEWNGSFSDAFNFGMQFVETTWTLRLDSDEWLLPESRLQIRKLIENETAFAYYLLRQDLAREDRWSECWLLRLWRTDPNLKHQGIIHEHFPDEMLETLAGERKVYQVPVAFRHDGYLGGVPMEKHRRNLECLRQELAVRPGQLYYEVELANTMAALEEPGADEYMAALLDKVLASAERPLPLAASLIGAALSRTKDEDLHSERTQALLDAARRWFDASPPMLWMIAQTEVRRGKAQEAFRALLKLEEISETGVYEREWTFDPRIFGENLWANLMRIAEHLGEDEVARRNRKRLESGKGTAGVAAP